MPKLKLKEPMQIEWELLGHWVKFVGEEYVAQYRAAAEQALQETTGRYYYPIAGNFGCRMSYYED